MHVQIDTQQMRDCMDLWRQALATRVPAVGKQPTGPDRAQTLAKVGATIDGWLDLLRLCTPQGKQDIALLQQLTDEVAGFKAWAEQARLALNLVEGTRQVDAQPKRGARPPKEH